MRRRENFLCNKYRLQAQPVFFSEVAIAIAVRVVTAIAKTIAAATAIAAVARGVAENSRYYGRGRGLTD